MSPLRVPDRPASDARPLLWVLLPACVAIVGAAVLVVGL